MTIRSLTIRDVEVRAAGRALVSGASLTLHPGELAAVIGPSGSGKSTLLKAILGMKRLVRGHIEYAGAPIRPGERVVGYVPQDDALHRSLTVWDALEYSSRLRLPDLSENERRQRIEALCHRLGLTDRTDVRIRRLSGGQRKRVSVAIELLTAPRILVLDEPTSGLDPGMEAQLTRVFAELAREGRVVLTTTHTMSSLELCDAVALLVEGLIVYFGPPGELLAWFGVARLEDLFGRLSAQPAPAWRDRYLGSPLGRRFASRAPPHEKGGA